ncbi:hypothetical protein FOB87_00010 [Mycolicibacterium smegmatis]|nr:hypothetical protein FOB87_00010 [Mycolicibacterium smegmatis]
MTDDPLVPLPAATVMLIRDVHREGRADLEVFLMRRHAAMDFVAGVMVFPGGGVDDRDRNADIAWYGPEPSWWAQRLGVDEGLAEALVCAAARETFEESGVLFAGPRTGPVTPASSPTRRCTATRARPWPTTRCRSPTSCATRSWCCAPTCCGRGPTG